MSAPPHLRDAALPETDGPDVRRLASEALSTGAFPAGTRQDFRTFFRPAVHAQIWKHASEDTSVEICGVLVGLWQRDDAGPFALVSESIRCDAAKSGIAEVTFTHDAWTKINHEMDTRFADSKIVGWYHSHPNFGIFLSDRDVFIHQHFFSGSGQIAHVVDPVRKIDGVFAWEAGKPALRPHFWVGERICVTPDKPVETSVPDSRTAAGDLPPRRMASLVESLTPVLLLVCVFLIGFLLPGRMTDFDRRLDRQRDLFGVMAYFAERKLLRPGLDDNLATLAANFQSVASEVDRLASQNSKREGADDKAQQKQWDQLRENLAELDRQLAQIRRNDLLRPDEEALVKDVMRAMRTSDLKELMGKDKPADTAEAKATADVKRSARPGSAGQDASASAEGKGASGGKGSSTAKAPAVEKGKEKNSRTGEKPRPNEE